MLSFRNSISLPSVKKEFTDDWSLSFDGVDDTVVLRNPFTAVTHSISFWVKVEDGTGNRAIFDGRDSSNDGVFIYTPTNDKINYKISSGASLVQTTAILEDWQHIVCTYDGTTQKLYVNGDLDASQELTAGVSTTQPATIGSKSFSSGTYWLGLIDDFALFGTELTEAEVTQIYNSGEPFQLNCNHANYVSARYLQGYYIFENESGGTDTGIINDYSPYNNYGTKSGTTFSSDTP